MPVRYIEVDPKVNLFKPVERAFGDLAIIGKASAPHVPPPKPDDPIPPGTLLPDPVAVTNPDSVSDPSNIVPGAQGKPVDSGFWFKGDLGTSVRLAFAQSPGPSKVWALAVDTDDEEVLKAAFGKVAKLPVQIVMLANTPLAARDDPKIKALATHVTTVSRTGGDGKERIGVAMLEKGKAAPSVAGGLVERMVVVAHNSGQDAAAAVAGTIAGYEPHVSLLLKPVAISQDSELSDADIDALNAERINWLTDPPLIPGQGVHLGEGYTLDPDKFIDTQRVLDDVTFRLKARLIRTIGNLTISRGGLRSLTAQMAAILQPLVDRGVLDTFDVFIPILALLDKDPATLTPAEVQQIRNARSERVVSIIATVVYNAAIHRIRIALNFE